MYLYVSVYISFDVGRPYSCYRKDVFDPQHHRACLIQQLESQDLGIRRILYARLRLLIFQIADHVLDECLFGRARTGIPLVHQFPVRRGTFPQTAVYRAHALSPIIPHHPLRFMPDQPLHPMQPHSSPSSSFFSRPSSIQPDVPAISDDASDPSSSPASSSF